MNRDDVQTALANAGRIDLNALEWTRECAWLAHDG